jgi:pyruvate dehydrogenase E2 component (dihydrolipoamide acetyltransferase)
MSLDVVVPDLGDFDEVEVIEILVKPGDSVAVEDPLISLETEKATMDVPSSAAGKVLEIKVAVGDSVSAGDVIVVLDSAELSQAEESDAADETQASAESAESPEAVKEQAADETPAAEPAAAGSPQTVVVPDLGDFSDVEVIEVLVAVGDEVEVEQGLISLETEKATMDVPSTVAGVVADIRVKIGQTVNPGDEIVSIRPRAGSKPAAKAPQPSKPDKPAAKSQAPKSAASSRPAKPAAGAGRAAPRRTLGPVDEAGFSRAHASPSVRKLARELGVDLGRVGGSGHKGRITADDLKSFVKEIMLGGAAAGAALPEVPEVDFAKFGAIETQKLSRIQKISGPRLHASWVNVPHVTQHDEADISDLEKMRQSLKGKAAERGIKLTPLAFVIRACVLTLAEFPTLKSSLSPDGENLVLKRYTHVGFAADTPNGLVVPVIRDADKKDIYELAASLGDLSERARDGKLKADDMQGGVFTVSSLGGIGGTFFTPIINAPEVAILGVSRNQWKPVWRDEQFVPRLILPLSLSYDHRVIDGATAVRFTTRLAETLADTERLVEAIP